MSNNLWYCTPINLNDTIENFEANCPTNPNPTALSYNTGGPAWCQWFVTHSVVPSSIQMGKTYTIPGNPTFTITPYSNGITVVNNKYSSIDGYVANNTYQLGVVINVNGINYMNVVWDESKGPTTANNRGQAYSGTYGSSPTQDTNAWKQVTITGVFAPNYDNNAIYPKGKYVTYNDKVYQMNNPNLGSGYPPDPTNGMWGPVDPLVEVQTAPPVVTTSPAPINVGSTATGLVGTSGADLTKSSVIDESSSSLAGVSDTSSAPENVPAEWIKGVNNNYVMMGVAGVFVVLIILYLLFGS